MLWQLELLQQARRQNQNSHRKSKWSTSNIPLVNQPLKMQLSMTIMATSAAKELAAEVLSPSFHQKASTVKQSSASNSLGQEIKIICRT